MALMRKWEESGGRRWGGLKEKAAYTTRKQLNRINHFKLKHFTSILLLYLKKPNTLESSCLIKCPLVPLNDTVHKNPCLKKNLKLSRMLVIKNGLYGAHF